MGTPAPDNEPVTGCSLCFLGPDRLGPIQPKYVTVDFRDVRAGAAFQAGNFIPHGPFRLQHVSDCLYRLVVSGEYAIRLNWGAVQTFLSLAQLGSPITVWLTQPGNICATVFDEFAISAPSGVVFGGIITISWSTEGL